MRARENLRLPRWLLVTTFVAALVVAGTGVAAAVSGGGYSPGDQDCTPTADRNDTVTKDAQGNVVQPGTAEAGCHNIKGNVTDDEGNRYAEAGLDQLPDGYPSTPGLLGVGVPGSPNFPHSGCAALNTAGTGGGAAGPDSGCGAGQGAGASGMLDAYDPSASTAQPQTGSSVVPPDGVDLYFGADDNLDAGEHDGVDDGPGTSGSVNGPSDGGAVRAHASPNQAATTPSATNPVPVVGAAEGFCADGICQEVTTYRQAIYQGNPDGDSTRDVANYDGKQFDPYNCSSGSAHEEGACDTPEHDTMDSWRNAEAHTVYAEPGVQTYEDPDPQASPIDPLAEAGIGSGTPLYPLPGNYVGSCGVIIGGGPTVPAAPAGAPQNSAGQIVVNPVGC